MINQVFNLYHKVPLVDYFVNLFDTSRYTGMLVPAVQLLTVVLEICVVLATILIVKGIKAK